MSNDFINGSPLILEDLDLSNIGLYLEKDPTVPEDDYFDSGYRSFGRILWKRKSDRGKKWHVYNSSELVKWPEST